MLSKITLLFLLTSFAISTPYAQEPTLKLSGRIVGEDAKPLPRATVALLNQEQQELAKIAADSSGHFLLRYSVTDSCILVVSFSGYSEYRSNPFAPLTKEMGNIQLRTAAQALQEVVIEAKQNLIEAGTNTITYNVSKSIDAQGVSALEALKKAPGVYVNT
ncbi:MAG TPA: carboxypeptidase-like regulatory domain-containing protein, partial [Flavisolibacter sp.]|nr:carboxypeptidase-like regulatory domain-containing protein [Flavisolibacter sp.]